VAGAQVNLGVRYATGRGVGQNFGVALMWLRRGADQGDAVAQFYLGGMYARGQGVPPNATEAYKWLSLAVSRASAESRAQYAAALELVGSGMTSAQIEDALGQAAAWNAAFDAARR